MRPLLRTLAIGIIVMSVATSPVSAQAPDTSAAPKVFEPGIISLPEMGESSASVTADHQTILFTRYENYGRQVPYVAEREGNAWTVQQATFTDTLYNAAIAPDGRSVVWRSARTRTMDEPPIFPRVFRTMRTEDGSWGETQELENLAGLNAGYFDIQPDGTLYFFAFPPDSTRIGGKGIYISELQSDGSYSTPERVSDEVSPGGTLTFDPHVNEAGTCMVVARAGIPEDEQEVFGPRGLYVHRKWNGQWDSGKRLPVPYGWSPVLLEDRLLYVRDGDVQSISLAEIGLDPSNCTLRDRAE